MSERGKSTGDPIERLRLTVGKDNTPEQIDYVLDVLPGTVSRIRSLSPAWPERELV